MIKASVLTLLLLASAAVPAHADDATIWKARVGKAAPKAYNLSTAPILCFCNGGVGSNYVGHLLQGVQLIDAQNYIVSVECVIPLVSFVTGDIDTNAIIISCANFTQLLK